MKYDMLNPCDNCPFRREGGIRLTKARAKEIGGMMMHSQGGTFPCHKTLDFDEGEYGGTRANANSKHCAGALIFAEKNGKATQMMRIIERLGLYDHAALMANTEAVDAVFNDLREMVAANGEKRARTKKKIQEVA